MIRQYLIWVRDSIFLLGDLARYRLTGKMPHRGYEHLISAFCLLGGAVNPLASRFLGSPKLPLSNSGLLGYLSPHELNDAVRHLKSEGYVVLENVLSDEICEEFLTMSMSIPGQTRVMDGNKGSIQELYFDRKSPTSVRVDYSADILVEQAVVQGIIADESLANFAQQYLGSAPILDLVTMWWHTTYSKNPDKQAAQWFHYDMDRVRWVKFFFYLTDVTPQTGPHTYVPKSHRAWQIPFALRKQGYSRLSDEEVESHFKKETWKEFVGKRGTLIIEDTRGLHKGKHCIDGDRLLFQIEFTSSPFGAEIFKAKFSDNQMTQNLRLALSKYPKIYGAIQK